MSSNGQTTTLPAYDSTKNIFSFWRNERPPTGGDLYEQVKKASGVFHELLNILKDCAVSLYSFAKKKFKLLSFKGINIEGNVYVAWNMQFHCDRPPPSNNLYALRVSHVVSV